MREAEAFDVGDQALGKLAICQEAVTLLGHSRPGPEVAFIDAHWLVTRVALLAGFHPLRVAPLEIRQPRKPRGSRGPLLGHESDRIRLLQA
jgi:hypothetical protein